MKHKRIIYSGRVTGQALHDVKYAGLQISATTGVLACACRACHGAPAMELQADVRAEADEDRIGSSAAGPIRFLAAFYYRPDRSSGAYEQTPLTPFRRLKSEAPRCLQHPGRSAANGEPNGPLTRL